MRWRIVLTGIASRDLMTLAESQAATRLRAVSSLPEAAQVSFERLAERDDLGAFCEFNTPAASNVRVWPIRGFPNHLISDRVTNTEIGVLRVLHGARDARRLFDSSGRASDRYCTTWSSTSSST